MANSPHVGIDFGTTKTVCAVYESGHVRLLPGQDGKDFTPSCVLHTSGKWFVGWRAREHPDRFSGEYDSVSSVKRKMGRSGEQSWGSLKGYPQQVAAYILAVARREAEKDLGQEITGAVLAVPAHFHAIQRRATMEAAEIAGLQVWRLINEATAAAIAWSHRDGAYSERTVAVFDFGGGTLDVSVVQCGEGVYEVVGTAGNGDLGGDDIDRLLWRHISNQQQALYGSEKVTLGRGSLAEGLEIAEEIKKHLSSSEKAEKHIPGFVRVGKAYHALHYSLSRADFESMLTRFADSARVVWRRAVKGCPQPDRVILIGGTSHIPYVQRVIEEETRQKPVLAEGELVARGAAVVAAALNESHKEPNCVLVDVLPSTLSVATAGGVVTPLVERATTIPREVTKTFTTTEDGQASVDIVVCVGEETTVEGNVHLGRIRLAVPPGQKGSKQIDVTFSVDRDQVLNVTVKDKATGTATEAMIDSPFALNKAQVGRLRKEVENWKGEESLAECVPRLLGRIDSLLAAWANRVAPHAERELWGLRRDLEVPPSRRLVLRTEERLSALEYITEKVSHLDAGVREVCAEWRAEWGCEPTMLSRAPTLIAEMLRDGPLRKDLVGWIQEDIERHRRVLREVAKARSLIAELIRSASLTGANEHAVEARRWLDEVKSAVFTSAEDVEKSSRSGNRCFVRSLVRVFVTGDRAVQQRIGGEFSREICENRKRIHRSAFALLATGTAEAKWRALGALAALLATLGKSDLSPRRAHAVIDQLAGTDAWEMRALLGACIQQVGPETLAELCMTTPPIRRSLLADPACVELRGRVANHLRANLASPGADREDVWAFAEISPDEDALLSLVDSEISAGAREALYGLLGQTPRSRAIHPLLSRVPHDAEPLQRALFSCLREHVHMMTERERRLFLLAETASKGECLSLRHRLELRRIRRRDQEYVDLASFLLKRSGRT